MWNTKHTHKYVDKSSRRLRGTPIPSVEFTKVTLTSPSVSGIWDILKELIFSFIVIVIASVSLFVIPQKKFEISSRSKLSVEGLSPNFWRFDDFGSKTTNHGFVKFQEILIEDFRLLEISIIFTSNAEQYLSRCGYQRFSRRETT